MTIDQLQIAKKLAKAHYAIESSITHIYTITDKVHVTDTANVPIEPDNSIKLLEVNADTPASGVMPISFGPSPEIPYPSVIVEVTPAEFEKIRSQELKLPSGWNIGQELPKDGE